MRGAHSQDPRPAAASRLSSSHSAARDPKSAYKCIFYHTPTPFLIPFPCNQAVRIFPHGLVVCKR